MSDRTHQTFTPEQAAESGWSKVPAPTIAGHGADWETVCKWTFAGRAQSILKSTKRLQVPGGWLYQVTTEVLLPAKEGFPEHIECAEALAFVPDAGGRSDPTTLAEIQKED